MIAMQGIGVAAGGVVTELTGSSANTIGASGLLGVVCAVLAAVAWTRARGTGAEMIPKNA